MSFINRLWTNPGPDRGWSWCVCVSVFYFNFAYYGQVRSAGVIYNALLNDLGFTPADSARPNSLQNSVSFCAGILSGHCQIYLTLRWTTFFGYLLSTVSCVALFFGPLTVAWISIWSGFCIGLASGLSSPAMYQVVAEYFKEYRTTALATSLAGSAIGGLILPPLMSYCLEEYGLRGTYLICGCIYAQGLVFSVLLRKRDRTQFHSKYFVNTECGNSNPRPTEQPTEVKNFVQKIVTRVFPRTLIMVLTTPMFWVMVTASICFLLSMTTYMITFVAHVSSRGSTVGHLAVSVANLSDLLVGRFAIGFLTDKNLVSPNNLFGIVMFAFGLTLVLAGFCHSTAWLFVCAGFLGASMSGYLPLRTVLLAKYLGVRSTAFAVGVLVFLTGLLCFFVPAIIDLTTGTEKNFDKMYFVIGSLSIAAALVWGSEKLFACSDNDNSSQI